MEHSRFESAVACYRRSAMLAQQLGDRHNQALSLSNMGAAYADIGELDLAETCYQNSLALSRELDDRYGEARAYNNMGALAAHRGHIEQAVRYYEEGARVARAIGHLHREVMTLINIASMYAQHLQLAEAEPYLARAWEMAEAQGYQDLLAVLSTLHGDVGLMQQETITQAYGWFAQACQYAARHNPQTLLQITQHIQSHLQRLRQQHQVEEVRAFCTVLLDVWTDKVLYQQQPEFVTMLQETADSPSPYQVQDPD